MLCIFDNYFVLLSACACWCWHIMLVCSIRRDLYFCSLICNFYYAFSYKYAHSMYVFKHYWPNVWSFVKLTLRLVILSRSWISSLYGSEIMMDGGNTRKITWKKTTTTTKLTGIHYAIHLYYIKYESPHYMGQRTWWMAAIQQENHPVPAYSRGSVHNMIQLKWQSYPSRL